MKLAEPLPADVKVWTCERWIDVVDYARKLLVIHGFISDAENDKVRKRIDKAARKEGLIKA